MEWVQYILVLICVALAAGYLVRTVARSMTRTGCEAKGCAMATRDSETTLKRTPLVQIGSSPSTSPTEGAKTPGIDQ